MPPFTSNSFVSLLSPLFAVADSVKQVRQLLALSFQLVCFFTVYFVCVCVCVSEVGLAEMSKAGSHAVSGAADIAPAVGGSQGARLKVKEL